MGLRKPPRPMKKQHAGKDCGPAPDATAHGPEYYNERFERVDQERRPTKWYAEDTERAIERMQCKWKEYCDFVKIDAVKTLEDAVFGRFTNFFHWFCNKFTVKKVSSIETYWRTLSQLYNKLKGQRMAPSLLNQMAEYIHNDLADEHDLDESETDKPLLDVEDLWEVLQCHWVTDTNKFPSERLRVELATILLFAACTASRPRALLGITYGDLDCFVQRDPREGTTQLMLQVKLTKTKSRKKRARPKTYTFTLDDNPFFCIPLHFISLAQHDGAFVKLADGSRLTAEQLLSMGIRTGLKSQPIPFRKDMKDKPLFRMTYEQLNHFLKRLGIETGFNQIFSSYCIRRASGNAVNDDPLASDAVRNLVMDHTDSKIFQRNYLSRMVRYDVQAAYLGSSSKIGLIQAAGRMSRLMDPRRPKKLSKEQRDSILCEPEIRDLQSIQKELYSKIRAEFKFIYKAVGQAEYEDYRRTQLDLYATIRSRERALLAEIRNEYDASVPLKDMLEQINGNSEPINSNATIQETTYGFPERFRIAKLFLESMTTSFPMEVGSAKFVNDLVSLCGCLESRVGTRKRIFSQAFGKEEDDEEQEQRGRRDDGDIKVSFGAGIPLSKTARLDVEPASPKPTDRERFRCLVCTGRTELSLEDRLRDYGSKYSLKRHFRRLHPIFVKNSDCPHPECDHVVLEFKTDFMNHAATLHGIDMDERTWLE